MKDEMRCKKCSQNDLNEVIILRKRNFTSKGKYFLDIDTLDRVCFYCFRKLMLNGFYKIDSYWLSVLYDYQKVK